LDPSALQDLKQLQFEVAEVQPRSQEAPLPGGELCLPHFNNLLFSDEQHGEGLSYHPEDGEEEALDSEELPSTISAAYGS
jgi:sugar lactone lactonase YvrE